MGRYKTLIANTGLMFIGSFGSKIISFIMLPFYTMWLSVEDYGTSDIINVYATVLVALVSLCVGEAIFVIPSQKPKEDQTSYFSTSLVFSACSIVFLVLFFLVVRYVLGNIPGAFSHNIGYICLITATTLYTTIFQQFCKGINKIKTYATAGIVQTLVVASLGFLLIPQYKLDGFIWCILFANVITLIYIYISAKLYGYVSFAAFSYSKLRELFSYSLPLIPNSVIWLIVSYLNRPLMETYLGLYAIGIYSLANRFPTLINTIYNNFSNSWQISILDQYGKDGFTKFYNNVILMSFSVMSLIIVAISLMIRPVIILFFNVNYYDSIVYVPILSLSCLFISLGSMTGAIFAAVKKSIYYLYSSVWSAATAVIFNIILINKYGIYGACWACVLSYLIGGFSRLIYAQKFESILYTKSIIIISFLTTLFVCVVSYNGSSLWSIVLFMILMIYDYYIVQRMQIVSIIKQKIKLKSKTHDK